MAKAAQARHDDDDTVDLQGVIDDYDKDQAMRGMFRPKSAGEFKIRILPPREVGMYFESFGLHYNVAMLSPKLSDQFAVGCYQRTLGQECPLCEIQKKLYFESKKRGDETLGNLAKKLYANDKFVCNVIDVENPKQGVQTWEYARKVHDKIRAIFKKKGNIAHSVDGKDLELTYEKKKIEGNDNNVCENVALGDASGPLNELYPKWREERKDLAAYAKSRLYDKDKLEAICAEAEQDMLGTGGGKPKARRTEETDTAGEADPDVVAGEGDDNATDDTGTDAAPAGSSPSKEELEDPEVQEVLAKLRGRQKK